MELIEIYVLTLTGAKYELHVSPFESVLSVKEKIQALEGIPASQQHLIFTGQVLNNDSCLHEYQIGDGASLQLILQMRGGPVSTRQLTTDSDLGLVPDMEMLESMAEELWPELPQVTLLIFRDGENLNFYRVLDRGDGTVTPLSDSYRQSPVLELKSSNAETERTKAKMAALRMRMNELAVVQRREDGDTVSDLATTSTPAVSSSISSTAPMMPAPPSKPATQTQLRRSALMRPTSGRRVARASPRPASKASSSSSVTSLPRVELAPPAADVKEAPLKCPPYLRRMYQQEKQAAQLSASGNPYATQGNTRSMIRGDTSEPPPILRSLLPTTATSTASRLPKLVAGGTTSTASMSSTAAFLPAYATHLLAARPLSRSALQTPAAPLPVPPPATVRRRCEQCSKKLRLATTFTCRCGSLFCPQHRYPESHSCGYDFKTEGRQQLALANPVVQARKLPKI